MHENPANLFHPACREDFLWLPYPTHQPFIWSNRVKPLCVRWRNVWRSNKTAVSPHADLPAAALARADSGSVQQAGQSAAAGRSRTGGLWHPAADVSSQGSRCRHTHTRTVYQLHILVYIWLTRMPPHRYNRLVFIPLRRRLSAAIKNAAHTDKLRT